MLFVARIDVDALVPSSSNLSLGHLFLLRPAAVPALNFLIGAVLLWTTRHSTLALYKGQLLTIRVVCTLQPWWGYVVGEYAYGLDHCLGEVVGSFRHVVLQVYLELVVPAIVGSAEQHAREVAFEAYLLGFLDVRTIRGIDV